MEYHDGDIESMNFVFILNINLPLMDAWHFGHEIESKTLQSLRSRPRILFVSDVVLRESAFSHHTFLGLRKGEFYLMRLHLSSLLLKSQGFSDWFFSDTKNLVFDNLSHSDVFNFESPCVCLLQLWSERQSHSRLIFWFHDDVLLIIEHEHGLIDRILSTCKCCIEIIWLV